MALNTTHHPFASYSTMVTPMQSDSSTSSAVNLSSVPFQSGRPPHPHPSHAGQPNLPVQPRPIRPLAIKRRQELQSSNATTPAIPFTRESLNSANAPQRRHSPRSVPSPTFVDVSPSSSSLIAQPSSLPFEPSSRNPRSLPVIRKRRHPEDPQLHSSAQPPNENPQLSPLPSPSSRSNKRLRKDRHHSAMNESNDMTGATGQPPPSNVAHARVNNVTFSSNSSKRSIRNHRRKNAQQRAQPSAHSTAVTVNATHNSNGVYAHLAPYFAASASSVAPASTPIVPSNLATSSTTTTSSSASSSSSSKSSTRSHFNNHRNISTAHGRGANSTAVRRSNRRSSKSQSQPQGCITPRRLPTSRPTAPHNTSNFLMNNVAIGSPDTHDLIVPIAAEYGSMVNVNLMNSPQHPRPSTVSDRREDGLPTNLNDSDLLMDDDNEIDPYTGSMADSGGGVSSMSDEDSHAAWQEEAYAAHMKLQSSANTGADQWQPPQHELFANTNTVEDNAMPASATGKRGKRRSRAGKKQREKRNTQREKSHRQQTHQQQQQQQPRSHPSQQRSHEGHSQSSPAPFLPDGHSRRTRRSTAPYAPLQLQSSSSSSSNFPLQPHPTRRTNLLSQYNSVSTPSALSSSSSSSHGFSILGSSITPPLIGTPSAGGSGSGHNYNFRSQSKSPKGQGSTGT